MNIDKPVIVLDVVTPGELPDYCCHGKATCVGCDEWVWLGHATFEVVNSGEALPLCLPCAIRNIPAGTKPFDRIKDHKRADGPHG